MTYNPKSLENLKKGRKFTDWDDDERKKANSKGGKKSGLVRGEKKTLSQLAEIFGNTKVSDETTKKKLKDQGIADEDMVQDMAMIVGLYASARRGNSNSARVLAELKGALKQQQTNVTVTNNVNPYAGLSEEELRKLAEEKE